MISNLTVLNSSFTGSRDIYWVDDPDRKLIGYNIYKSHNAPGQWVKLNDFPHPGCLYRDQTTLTSTTHAVVASDWVSCGIDGQWVFKIPDILWSSAVKGRALVANHPDDITLVVNGSVLRAGSVNGQEGLVYLSNAETLRADGSISTAYANPFHAFKDVVPADLTVSVTYKKLTNYVDIFLAGLRTFYTVVPVLENGTEAHILEAAGSPVANNLEVDNIDYMQAEMIRRNQWIFEQCGEPAYLLIRKSRGVVCECTISNGEPRTGCPACYETGVIGGYYGPLDILFIDPDTAAVRTLDEGGVKVERSSRSYLSRTPLVHSGDLIIRRNGERMVIANVVYKSPRGVLLQQDFDVEVLQPRDTRYLIPLGVNPPPNLVDPRFGLIDPTKEPMTDPLNDPTKHWENPTTPEGRTVTFGNIMS